MEGVRKTTEEGINRERMRERIRKRRGVKGGESEVREKKKIILFLISFLFL